MTITDKLFLMTFSIFTNINLNVGYLVLIYSPIKALKMFKKILTTSRSFISRPEVLIVLFYCSRINLRLLKPFFCHYRFEIFLNFVFCLCKLGTRHKTEKFYTNINRSNVFEFRLHAFTIQQEQ